MRAGQNADAENVDILLDRGLHQIFRRIVAPGIDHLHSRVSERHRDENDAAIVPAQAWLAHEHPYFPS